jgi:uncharacterized protein (TIGR02611 family)
MLCATRCTRRKVRLTKIIIGFGLLTGGIAMLALPGPGWLTIAAGLALLAAEFSWARRALDRLEVAGGQLSRPTETREFKWLRSWVSESFEP